MKTIDDLINKLREWSENKPQPKGLSQETIDKVSEYCVQHFDCQLPQDFANFLKEMNGFSYNDRSIFCCYNEEIKNDYPRYTGLDLVAFNEKFSANTDIADYLFLGRSSQDYIAYSKKNKNYVIVDNGDVVHGIRGEYETFEEFILNFIGEN